MVHPYSGDIISVRNKLAHALSDDRGIGTVHTYTAVIGYQHIPDARRLHNQQCQAVLPQISPTSSALSIIVMGEKGTSK